MFIANAAQHIGEYVDETESFHGVSLESGSDILFILLTAIQVKLVLTFSDQSTFDILESSCVE